VKDAAQNLMQPDTSQEQHSPAQSWDQANLKRNDNGCPTGIYYISPATGLLVQCPPM
jgi:hypothetical protein